MDEQKPNWSSPKVVLIVHDQFCQIQLRLNYYYEKDDPDIYNKQEVQGYQYTISKSGEIRAPILPKTKKIIEHADDNGKDMQYIGCLKQMHTWLTISNLRCTPARGIKKKKNIFLLAYSYKCSQDLANTKRFALNFMQINIAMKPCTQ